MRAALIGVVLATTIASTTRVSAHPCNSSVQPTPLAGRLGLQHLGRGQCGWATTLNQNATALNAWVERGGDAYSVASYGAVCDGTTDDQAAIQAAATAADAVNADVVIPWSASGCAIGSAIAVPGDVTIRGGGVGKGARLVAKSTFSGTAMLVFAGAGGGGTDGIALDLTAAPAANGISVSGTLRTHIRNTTITYSAGTGTAIALGAVTLETHLTNVAILQPGIGINGVSDDGSEQFYRDVVIESPADTGFRFARTTATDVGALYLHGVKVTNPAGRTSAKGFVFTSSASGTAMPVFLLQCVADGMLGGPGLDVTNVHQLYVDNSWFANAAAAGAAQAGIRLTNVSGFYMSTTRVHSSSRALVLAGTVTGIRASLNLITAPGQTAIYLDSTPTLSDNQIANNQFVAGSISNDLQALALGASGAPTFLNGLRVNVATGSGTNPTVQLCNVNTGSTNACKTLRVGTTGSLEVVNNANDLVTLTLTDDGQMTSRGGVPTAQTIGSGGTIAADACGGIKRISSAGAVVTSTSNTFTAPGTSNTGCVMEVVNSGANQIDLDLNGNFDGFAADDTGSDGDIDLAAGAVVRVASDGVIWRQLTRVGN